MSANFKYKITRVFFMCMWLHTSEDPHGPVHSADITTDQHFHKQRKELRPSLRPVPVGDGWNGVSYAGADFANGLPETPR